MGPFNNSRGHYYDRLELFLVETERLEPVRSTYGDGYFTPLTLVN